MEDSLRSLLLMIQHIEQYRKGWWTIVASSRFRAYLEPHKSSNFYRHNSPDLIHSLAALHDVAVVWY